MILPEPSQYSDRLNTKTSYKQVTSSDNLVKKLKSLDLPDLITTVKSKKLPKEALRGVLGRFKLNEDKIELVESVDTLKENATKEFETYVKKNILERFKTVSKKYY